MARPQDTTIAPDAVDGRSEGLWWDDLPAKPRPTTQVVVHWTGGDGRSARDVHQVLRNRGLSIHFVIDPDGRITQMAPLDARAAHAGSMVNARSVGIEVVGPGPVREGLRPDPRRPLVEARIHGRRVRYYDFTPEQYEALFRLVPWLLDYFNIPKQVSSATTAIAPRELVQYRGVIGHYQITTNKVDPGPRVLDILRENLTRSPVGRRWWVLLVVLLIGGGGLYWFLRNRSRKAVTA